MNNHFGYACYSPAFWFRRQFLLDNSFFFREGVIFEDAELIPRILLKSQRVKFIPLICYNYFIRSGSSIQRVSEKKYRDLKSVIESVDNLNSLDTNGYFDRLYSSLVVLGIRLVASDMYKDYRVDFLSFLSKMSRKLVDFDKSTLNRSIIGMLRLSPNMALNVLVILRKISGR